MYHNIINRFIEAENNFWFIKHLYILASTEIKILCTLIYIRLQIFKFKKWIIYYIKKTNNKYNGIIWRWINFKKKINEYIKKCKPKYFNKEEINELIELMKNVNNYFDKSEIIRKNKYDDIKKENVLLKTKLDTIKINLENNINVQSILIYLDNLKNDGSLAIRIILKIYLYIFYILFYFLTIYNNKKIIKRIR